MLNLWNWLVSHADIIEAFFGGAVVVGVPALLTLRGQREARRLADERSRLELKAQRKQFCIPLLISIHELAPVMAELRKAHDNLRARQELIFRANSYLKRVNPLFEAIHKRSAVAGSELSIDPAGQKVMDAYLAYLKAQDEYVQAMLQPLRKVQTRFFGKTDISTLDGLAKKANDTLTALEETIRVYVDSPPDASQPSRIRWPGTSLSIRWMNRLVQRSRRGGTSPELVKP